MRAKALLDGVFFNGDARRRQVSRLVVVGLIFSILVPLSQAAALAADSVPPGSVATQSSTSSGADAARAIDGNVSGHWGLNSVSHTNFDTEAWWAVDMQSSIQVDRVRIWNRTDCCTDRLADFYLFVSDLPFASTDVATTLADPNVTSVFHAGPAPNYLTLEPGVTGRDLRIQLTGTNYLHLAEVQVNTDSFNALADETWGVANPARSLISFGKAEVYAIEQIGNTVYVGGKYNNVVRRRTADPQVDQPYLAAFDATTGDYIDWWTPELNGAVYALEASADGSRLYVGGEFTEVNGHPDARGIVALDPESGMIDHTWFAFIENFYVGDPGVVRTIQESEGWVYVGGSFTHVQGMDPSSRRFVNKVARLSPANGAPDTNWLPQVLGGSVRGVAHDPVRDRVYLTGYFDSIGSLADTDEFATVSDVDGSVITGLNRFPELTPNQDHHFDVIAHGDYVWLAGTQHVVHMLNASDLSINKRWFTGFENGFHIGGDYQALGILGDKIYATCHCWGVIRELNKWVTTLTESRNITPLDSEAQGIMGFDLATGELDASWLPDTFGSIGGWALHGAPDGCLWAGGDFNRTNVGDQWRNSVHRYCPESGQGPPVGPPLTQPPLPETNPPTAPGNVVAVENGDNTVDLSWNASTDDTAVVYYRLYRNGGHLQATRGLSLSDLAASPGDTYTIRAVDAYETESADSAVAAPVLAGLIDGYVNTSFNGSAEGFAYSDDVFRSTTAPDYADPIERRHGSAADDGNLMVKLGGYDDELTLGMSGAYEQSFTLPTAMDVQVSVEYNLFTDPSAESDEYGEALLAVDGTLYGNGGNDYLARIANGGESGWSTFTTELSLGAGPHTISLGGFMNKKTSKVEYVEVSFDNVLVAPVDPYVGFTDPTEGSTLGGVVPMELRATDLSDASSLLTVEVSSNGGVDWDPAAWNGATGRFDFTLDVSGLPEGTLDLMARATDTDGNITTVTVPFEVDNDTDPTIAITEPTEGSNVTATVTVEVDANDAEDPVGSLDVEVRTDGATWNTAAWNGATSRYEYSWDTTVNGAGPATVEARVTDSALATVVAAPVNVTVVADPGTNYPDTVLADGADVYWRLGESAGTTMVDELGNNDEVYQGSPTLGAPGVIVGTDTAVDFDGTDDRVDITSSAEINQGGPYTAKTIELWFNADTVSARQVLMEQGSITRGLNFYIDGGQLYAMAWNTSDNGGNTPWGPTWVSTPISADTDYHAVMVLDGTGDQLSLYLNGALADSTSGVGDLYNHGTSSIASQAVWARYHNGSVSGTSNYFNGTLDEIAVYNSVLSPSQIATHHVVGNAASSDPVISIESPSEGASVTNTIPVVVNAADPDDPVGSLDVEVRIDGGTWETAAWNGATSRYEYSWDTTVQGDGPATIEAQVTDMTPVTVAATPVNVTVFTDSGIAYDQTVLGDNPDVYWRLGESSGTTMVDELGNNDEVYEGNPTLGLPGIVTGASTAVDFDGVDDRVAITNSPEINQGGPYTAKTIELWFNADTVSTRQVLMEQGSVTRGLNFYIDGGQLYAMAWNTSDNGGNTPWGPTWVNTPISADTDYHAVMVLDGTGDQLSLYLNGALADSTSGVGDLHSHGTSSIASQASGARFHTSYTGGGGNYFNGTLDEVAVYNSLLGATAIATHYSVGSASSTEPTIAITEPGEGELVTGTVNIEINATDADDPVGSLDVEVRIDGGTWETAAWSGATSRYEYSWDTTVQGDGPATIEAQVTDMTPVTVAATPVNVTVFTAPGVDYRDTVLNDGAWVYWRLGEAAGTTVVDETGGNDAEYEGGPTLGVTGLITGIDTAVDFDGVDDRIDVTNAPEINQGGPYLTKTIELWFNADDVSGRHVLIEQGSVSRGLNIYIDGGRLYAGAYNTTDNGGDTPWGPVWVSTPVSADTDYHVVMVFDQPADTLSLFVNGSLAESANGIGELHNHGLTSVGSQRAWARFHTGAVQGDINFFDGTLDEIAIYPTALSAVDIAAHYTAGIS